MSQAASGAIEGWSELLDGDRGRLMSKSLSMELSEMLHSKAIDVIKGPRPAESGREM